MTENTSSNPLSEAFWKKAETEEPSGEAPVDESDEDKALFEGDTGELPEIGPQRARASSARPLFRTFFKPPSLERFW